MSTREIGGDLIIKQFSGGDEQSFQNPTVLSCGGIYIPQQPEHQKILYHIITTSSHEEPVKILTGARPRNVLYEVLLKESMN